MKLHLPVKLFRAVLACMVAVFSTAAVSSTCYAAEYINGNATYNTRQVPPLTLTDYSAVRFSGCNHQGDHTGTGNDSYGYGGAIYGGIVGTYERVVDLSANGTVSFVSNYATVTSPTQLANVRGGAIFGYGCVVTMSYNDSVSFINNYAKAPGSAATSYIASGGALYSASSGSITMKKNADVSFTGNYALAETNPSVGISSSARGGAIAVEAWGTVNLEDNDKISFAGNYASSNSYYHSGSYSARGGALYQERGTMRIANNKEVNFSRNYTTSYIATYNGGSSYGGAIYVEESTVAGYGTLSIEGNDSVIFRGNNERLGSEYRLRSIYTLGTEMKLSAGANQSIVFYDTVYAAPSVEVSYNASYEDADGVLQQGLGDIIFSGIYAEDDLKSLKSGYTEAELTNSLTSEVQTNATLYGGRLIVEDKAILKGQGITAAADSGATVRVKDGTLDHSGYALTFNNSTTFEAEGVNSVTASSVDMMSGSTLSFGVDDANLTTAALTLTGTLTTGAISVAISGLDDLEAGNYTYALLSATSYDTTAWTSDKITVTTAGVSFDDLVWDNGTLYLNYSNFPVLTTATWNNGSGDRLWNSTSVNWTQGDYSYAYADGVDVIFGNGGAGTVTLIGELAPKSVLVDNGSGFDYTFAGAGKLTGDSSLIKQGEGKLTINTANDYTGGTFIKGGTVLAGNDYAFGNGVIELNGGDLNLNSKAVNNAIKVSGETEISGGSNYQGALSMVEGGHLTLKDGLNLAQGAQLNGGMVTADSVLRRETLACSTTNSTYENYGGVLFAPVYGEESGLISMEGNSDISFNGNTRQVTAQTKSNITAVLQSPTIVTGGSAIYGKWGVNFSGNDKILFENNRTEIKISVENIGTGADPISVRAYSRGIASGAVRGNSLVNLSGNKDVVFRGNEVKVESLAKATSGQGVAYAEAAGGAMNGASITMLENDNVLLENNIVEGAASSGSNRQAQGTSSAIGGAVYASSSIDIKNNDKVIVKGNATIASTTSLGGTLTASTTSLGGAIYTHSLTLTGNGDVLFSGNYEKLGSSYRLRSIYATGASVLGTHNSIVFEDSFYVGGTLNINDGYSGDIHITGEKTAAILEVIKGTTASADELKNSLTSEHAGLATLYGGRLIVENGAILKGQGITAVVNSGATVRVKDGTLNHSGYTLTFNNSTKLEAEGASSITASSVAMKAGSSLSFVVGEENLTTAALTLTGTLTTETISVAISGLDELETGRYTYALMKASSYDTSAWTADKITVATAGVSFDDLVWDNGTLYLNYAVAPALTTATWNNASGDGLWNATSINWTQGDYSYAYADGVDVIFGNEGAGTVSLVGNLAPKSVLINNGSGFDYTFAGEGKLTGAPALTKQGAGKLTINTANDYTGGTTINGGTLVAGNAAALGSGTVTLKGGTLEIAANGFANDITFAGDSSLMVDEGYELVLNKRIANSSYNLTLGGSITFKDISSTSSGGAIYNSGTFELSGNGDVTFCDNASSSGGAIYNSSYGTFTLSGNGDVTFSNNTASSSSSYGGAICNSSNGTFTLSGNGDVTFSNNTASSSSYGGAICNDGTFELSGNGAVTFCDNASSSGGAIYNRGTFELSGNGAVTFSNNTASSFTGGAIYNSSNGTFTLSGNGDVTFSNNTASSSSGGAIYTYSNSTFELSGNGDVTFCDNASSYSGGAIYNYSNGTFTLSGNEAVTFSNNTASSYGGAISNYSNSTFELSGNGAVTFSNNTASSSYGGAIYNYSSNGTFTLNDNETVTFSGNTAFSSNFTGGGAIHNRSTFELTGNGAVTFCDNASSSGGAIHNYLHGTFTLSGNGAVTFSNNTASSDSGGAIFNYSNCTFTLSGNGNVLFEKNVEVNNETYRLRSIYSSGILNLSSLEGKNITFRDSIYAGGTINLNQDYTDTEGVVHKSTGDIIFTGATTKADLREVKGGVDGTATEITNSRTSEIATMTNLYAGRLIVEDKAILKGRGITTAADSGATVRVKDGTLNHSGYALTFNNSTKLEAEGASSITASTVAMKAGSTLSFVVGEANLTTAALTLTGTLTTETISVDISGLDELEAGRYTYALMKASTYNTSAWTADKITVATDGVSFDDLVWDNGTLYLNYSNLPVLSSATWSNGSGDGKWNATSLNWTQDGYSYAYADGVDVIFGNEGAGTVSLEGELAPKSVLINNGSGFDYTFAGEGKLTGTTALTKQGEGKLTINTANDYTGGTTINGGTLVAGNAAALGTGAVAVNGGTLEIAANGFANDTSFAGTSSLVVDAGYQLALSKMLANSGVLTVSGTLNASSLTLNTIAATHIDVNGNSGTSGFAKGAIYSVQVVNGGTTSGADAAITHLNLPTGETLVLGENGVATAGGSIDYSEYLLTGSATAATTDIHAKGATATVTQNGGTLTVDDTVTVTTTGGTIALNGGTLNGTVSGATINATEGSIGATLSDNNTLNGSNYALGNVLTNGGVLTISGTISTDELTLNKTDATHINVAGASGANGFAKTDYYEVLLVNGGSVVNSNATITHADLPTELTLALGTDGIATAGGVVDYSNYLLVDATTSVSAIHGVEGASAATITQQGGTLTVDGDASVTTTAGNIALTSGTLSGTISGATINATAGSLAAALSGSNTINGTNYALQSVIANSGVLTVSGTINAAALTLDTTAATHIDVNGNSGASGFAKDAIYAVTIANGTTADSNATITHGEHTLTLGTDGVAKTGGTIDYSEYLLTGSATAATSAIHAKGASATVTQNNGTLTVDDAVTVATTGGTITLNGGTLNGTVSGATINAASGALNAALSGNNMLNGTNYALQSVIANSGVLTVSGTINAAALTLDTTAATHIDVNGNSGASGFAKDAIYAVTLANGTTVNSGATITHGEHTLTLGTDGVAKTGGAIDYSEYLLTDSASAATSAIHAKGAAATVTQNGGTLTVDDIVTVTATGGTLALNGGTLNGTVSGATINATSGALNAALSGNNTLNGNNYALGNVLSNAGALTISGTISTDALTLAKTDATHINVAGASGNNGFAKTDYYEVQLVNGGSVVNSNATITHADLPTELTLALGTNGIATAGGVVDYSNYLLVDATTSVSAIHGVEGASAATITQQGGTLTVDGDATVTTSAGNIALTSGTLSGTISGASISSTSGAATIAAAVSGASSVAVDGGSLTLAGANTYTGTTTVTAGALTVTGSLSGDIALNGGTLNTGSGMTLSNQTLALQGGSVVGNMVLGTGSLLSVDQVSGQTGNLTLGGGTIALSGKKLTLSGALTIGADSVLKLESGYTQEGEYELLGYDSLSGDLKQLQLAAISTTQETRQNYTLSSDGSVLKLTVDGNALVLNWAGGDGTWQSLGSTEWLLPESVSAADKRFHENDSVVFASGGNVTLVGELKPTAVTVGGTQNVTFGGSGSIVGATTLTKEGSSTLTMNAANAYTGGTLITDGVVNAGGAASFGSGEIALQGGELNLGNHAVSNVIQATGGKLSGSAYAGTAYVNGAVSVGDATQLAALVLNGGSISGGSLTNTAITANNGTINSAITGSGAVVSHGTVTLAGTNTYTGGTTIDGGELTVTGSVAGNINLTAGVLNTAAGMTLASGQTLYMAGGSVTGDLSLSAGSRAEVNAATTITGGLTLNGGTLAVSDKLLTLTGMLTVGAESTLDVSGYTTEGTYTLMQYAGLSGDVNGLVMPVDVNGTSRLNYTLSNSGTALVLTLDGNALTLTWKGGNGTWGTLDDQEWDLPEGVSVANARFYAADSVVFTKGGTVTVSGEVMPGNVLVNSAENLTLIGSGSITGATALTKQGNGTLTLNAANTYSGGTAISAGVVNAGGAGSFGSGKIALSGGELNLGAYAVTNAVEATGGKLSGTAYNGKLTVTGAVKLGNDTTANSVELVSGSLSEGSLTNTTVNATAGSISSRVTGSSTVNVNGNVMLSGANTYTGRTTLSGGTLTAGSSTAFGTGLVVVDAGTLNLGGYAVANTINAQSGTLTNAGAYAGTLNVNGNVALGGATTAAAVVLNSGSLTGGTLTSQAITAKGGTLGSKLAGACNVDISGTVSITGSNDYTGRTTVSSGQLNVGNASALGTSTVALKGGVLNLNGTAAGNAVTATAGTLSGATAYTGALTVKGDLTLSGVTTAGSMALEEGSISGGSIKDTTLTVTQGAIDSSFAGAVTLQATNWALDRVLTNTGVLTMGGSIDASALQLETESATFVDVSGNKGTSGFARTAAYAVKLVNGGSTVNNQLTVTHGEHVLTLGADGVAKTGGVVDYNTYYLNDATASVSAIHGVAGASSASITQTGGVLTVDGAATVTTTGGTIVLNSGTLNGTISGANINATAGSLAATLSGANTLNGTDFALGSVIDNQGTLTVSGTFDVSALELNTTNATHIDVNGNSGNSGFAKDAFYDVTIATGTVVNDGASVTHGEHTLTLGTDGVATAGGAINYGEYLLTGSDTASSSAIHGVDGASAATVTQNGGTLTVDDTVTVATTGGTIALNGGTLNGSVNGATINAASGTLNAILSGTNTLNGTDYALGSVIDNQGTLTISGSFDASGLTLNTTNATHIDANGNSGNSGFAKDAFYDVSIATGTVVNDGATVTHGEHTLTLGTDGVATAGGAIDYSEYLLTGNDTASSSAIHGVEGASAATVTQNGGTLTVDDTVTVTTTGGTIVLNSGTLNGTISGATINASSGALNATLSGTNTLNGTNYELQSVIDNQGSLTISGTFDATGLTLNSTSATHVDVNGNSGNSGFAKDAFYDVTIATGTVVNNGATVTHGEHTLTIGADGVATEGGSINYGEYLLTGSDTASSSAIHGVDGASSAIVTQNGGTLTVDDTVTVNGTGGSITLNGGTLNGTVQNMTLDVMQGTIGATLTGTNTLIGHDFALDTPLDNQGTLVLNGTFDLSGITPTISDPTHIDVNGNSGASGFAKSELKEVTIATGGNINASGATFTHNGQTLTPGEGGIVSVGGDVDYSKYLLTGSDTASSSAIHGVEGASVATVTQNGGTLTVDDTVTVATTAGTIVLNGGTLNGTVSGATINATSGTIGATLSGANTLNGNNYALGSVIASQGTLTISGTFDVSALTLNTTNASHIDVNGNSGASGFAKDAFYAVTLANGTVVNNGATVTHGTHSLTLGEDGVATAGGTVDYGTYFLHNGAEVAVSAIRAIPEAADAKVNMDGGKLAADADVFVTATGGRIDVSQGANVAGAITNTQIAIHGCEISADITGSSSVYVDGDTILSGHNTYTGNTEVHPGGYLTVSGSITSDVYLYAGTLDTATGMTLVGGQDIFFRGGKVKGNMATVSGSGLNLNQNSTLNGSLTLGGGTLTLSNGAVLTVSGSLTLDSPTKLVGDWAPDTVYTLIETGGITDNSGTASLNEFFGVSDNVGTVKQEGTRLILDTLQQIKPDAADIAVVNSLWGSLSSVRDFARLVEQQRLIGTPGQTTVWAGAFGSFTDVSMQHGFTANSGGYAVGVQHAFSEKLRGGVSLGQSTGTVESKGAERLKNDQRGMMAAALLQYEQLRPGKNSFLFNGYAAVGNVENDTKGAVNASWDDMVLCVGGRASYGIACGQSSWVVPFAGLEWSSAQQGNITRADGASYTDGELNLLTLPVGVSMRSDFTLSNGAVLAPEVTLAYEANLVKDCPQNTIRKGKKSCTAEGYDPGDQSFMLNASLNVLFDEHWSAGASYTIRTAEHSVNQSVNASVRYMF